MKRLEDLPRQVSGCASPMIFVVDDEWLIAFTLAQILMQQGLSAVWFTEPTKALEATGSQRPSMLITDYNMPLMSGYELSLAVRATCPECHVIMISAQIFLSEWSDATLLPSWIHLFEKPVKLEELFCHVKTILRGPVADSVMV